MYSTSVQLGGGNYIANIQLLYVAAIHSNVTTDMSTDPKDDILKSLKMLEKLSTFTSSIKSHY